MVSVDILTKFFCWMLLWWFRFKGRREKTNQPNNQNPKFCSYLNLFGGSKCSLNVREKSTIDTCIVLQLRGKREKSRKIA